MHFRVLFFKIIKVTTCLFFQNNNSYSQKVGEFDGQNGVGKTLHAGSAKYNFLRIREINANLNSISFRKEPGRMFGFLH